MLFGSKKEKETEFWTGDAVFPFDLVPVEELSLRLACPLKVIPRYVPRSLPFNTANVQELMGKKVAITGRPCSGKTREAIELIRNLHQIHPVTVFVLRCCLSTPIEFPEGLPTANIVLLIDDLPHLPSVSAPESLSEWRYKPPGLLHRLRATISWFEKQSQQPVTVIITARDEELYPIIERATSSWFKDTFKEIRLPNFTPEQTGLFIDAVCDATDIPPLDEKMRANFVRDGDGTLERYVHFFARKTRGTKITDSEYTEFSQNKDMFWHWIHLRMKNEERAIFRVLSLFRFYNIPAVKDLVIQWCIRYCEEGKGLKPHQIELAIDYLSRQYFNLWQNRIFCHDTRLKFEPVPFAHELDSLAQFLIHSANADKHIRPLLLGSLCELAEAAYLRHHYPLAKQILEFVYKYHRDHPQVNLTLALVHLALGLQQKKKFHTELATAIKYGETALRFFPETVFPYEHSLTQYLLAILYTELTQGNREDNARVALSCCKHALRYFTREQEPFYYAAVQLQLGAIHLHLTNPTRDDNLASAIDELNEALSIFVQGVHAEPFAYASMLLGKAYHELNLGDKATNLKNAMDNYFAALLVATRQSFPFDHVHLQVLLGKAYLELPTGETKENIGQALDCFREALTVYVPTEHSSEYANAQYLMGIGFSKLPGDKVRNLQQAIIFFKNALKIYTKAAYPTEHQLVTGALTAAEMELERLQKSSVTT
ncbi:MAG: hypothetical protein N3A72_05310 [bacterium]|nr:hypothetical protein [bacterium]